MSLSLKITSYQRLTPSQQSIYQATSDSFTIGRNKENDWAIPDPQRFLSGVHCRIHKEGAEYLITDTSTNGVFLNGSEQRLTRNDPVALQPGDKFRIGDYEFEVLIQDESLAGNPFASDAETMIGADPFDDPFSAPDSAYDTKPPSTTDPFAADDPFSDADPFADDDPFSEPDSFESTTKPEDNYLKDINTPLSHLDDSPLGKPVSIDDLMGFDDDEPDLEDDISSAKLEQSHTPLREAFRPSSFSQPSTPPDAPSQAYGADSASGGFDDFPDDWDETTGMLKIPEKIEPVVTPGPSEIPDNWDEATGMFIAPQAPAPAKAPSAPAAARPTPAAPARDVPAPARPAAPAAYAPPVHAGDAVAAFARGAGLEISQLAGIEQSVLFEQVGRMLVMFTEGLIQTLGGRTHIKSEFRLDQTMIRPAENNPFKFSTSRTRTLLQLLMP
jgi:type VI secretion system protein